MKWETVVDHTPEGKRQKETQGRDAVLFVIHGERESVVGHASEKGEEKEEEEEGGSYSGKEE